MSSATIVVTEALRALYPAVLHPKIHVVHDGIERPAVRRNAVSQRSGTRFEPIRAVLVTSQELLVLPVLKHTTAMAVGHHRWFRIHGLVGLCPRLAEYVRSCRYKR